MFLRCIQDGKQPEAPFDVYSAVTMSSVAILAHRSVLEGGNPFDIPDFHEENQRTQYENDHLSPFFGKDGSSPTLPCCSKTDYAPTEAEIAEYEALMRN